MEESEDPSGLADPAPVLAPARRWGLSLRVTLGLMALVALGFGAWMYHVRTIRAGLEMIKKHNGMYYFDFEYVDYQFVKKPKSWAPRWLGNLAGYESLHDVNYVRIVDGTFNDEDLAQLTRCFPRIICLGLDGTDITDKGLASLRGNRALEGLFVKSPGITDAGIDRLGLETLPKLDCLDIRNTQVSPSKAAEIQAFMEAREATAKRANPGKRVNSHIVLTGGRPRKAKAGDFVGDETTRESYEKGLEAEAGPPK